VRESAEGARSVDTGSKTSSISGDVFFIRPVEKTAFSLYTVKTMKLFIASDIHGSAYYTKKMLEAYEAERADRLILLGDLLYHGPRNDLPKEYAPKEVIALLNARAKDILCVRGNCDAEVDQMVLSFPIMADYSALFLPELGGRMVFATHGHVYNEEHLPPMHRGDILLHGHTHIPVAEDRTDYILLNPGSISIPKGEYGPSYMVYEEKRFSIQDFEGRVLIELIL
jgi:putative phosphoesterase